MRVSLILLCTLVIATFSGRAFAVTSTEWHSAWDKSPTQTLNADENTQPSSTASPLQNFSIYTGRNSYAPATTVDEHGDTHSILDAVRVGLNFKF